MNNLYQEFLLRLKTSNPAFFKKIQYAAAIIGGIAAFMAFFVGSVPEVPHWIQSVSTTLFTICGSVYFTSILPNEDKKPQENKPQQ